MSITFFWNAFCIKKHITQYSDLTRNIKFLLDLKHLISITNVKKIPNAQHCICHSYLRIFGLLLQVSSDGDCDSMTKALPKHVTTRSWDTYVSGEVKPSFSVQFI